MTKHTILFLAVDPVGTDRRAFEEDARAIQEEFERSGHRDRLELATSYAAVPLDLLRDLRKLKPTVVHFSGRGAARQVISSDAIARMLGAAGASVKLVVLDACFTESFTEVLLAHVDYVAGTSQSVSDAMSRSFAVGFYGGIADGESVTAAFRQGSAVASMEGPSDSDRPKIRIRDGIDPDGHVLAVKPAASASAAAAAGALQQNTSSRAVELAGPIDAGRSRDVSFAHDSPGITGGPGRNLIAVIGINQYQDRWRWSPLRNAARDAEGAAKLFLDLGFEHATPPLLNRRATRTAMWTLVTRDLLALGPDDSLVLFYAGHGGTKQHRLSGDKVVKTGYLIPADAQREVVTWIELESWLRAVALIPAKHILVILDACHSGIALDSTIKWRDDESWRNERFAALKARRSRRVMTSALDDQVAQDSGPLHGHSLFTGCLIEALRHDLRTPGREVTIGSELGAYVRRRVETYPHSRQTPDFGAFDFDERGELVIPLMTKAEAESAAKAQEKAAAMALEAAATKEREAAAAKAWRAAVAKEREERAAWEAAAREAAAAKAREIQTAWEAAAWETAARKAWEEDAAWEAAAWENAANTRDEQAAWEQQAARTAAAWETAAARARTKAAILAIARRGAIPTAQAEAASDAAARKAAARNARKAAVRRAREDKAARRAAARKTREQQAAWEAAAREAAAETATAIQAAWEAATRDAAARKASEEAAAWQRATWEEASALTQDEQAAWERRAAQMTAARKLRQDTAARKAAAREADRRWKAIVREPRAENATWGEREHRRWIARRPRTRRTTAPATPGAATAPGQAAPRDAPRVAKAPTVLIDTATAPRQGAPREAPWVAKALTVLIDTATAPEQAAPRDAPWVAKAPMVQIVVRRRAPATPSLNEPAPLPREEPAAAKAAVVPAHDQKATRSAITLREPAAAPREVAARATARSSTQVPTTQSKKRRASRAVWRRRIVGGGTTVLLAVVVLLARVSWPSLAALVATACLLVIALLRRRSTAAVYHLRMAWVPQRASTTLTGSRPTAPAMSTSPTRTTIPSARSQPPEP